jgi:hypothetical protein
MGTPSRTNLIRAHCYILVAILLLAARPAAGQGPLPELPRTPEELLRFLCEEGDSQFPLEYRRQLEKRALELRPLLLPVLNARLKLPEDPETWRVTPEQPYKPRLGSANDCDSPAAQAFQALHALEVIGPSAADTLTEVFDQARKLAEESVRRAKPLSDKWLAMREKNQALPPDEDARLSTLTRTGGHWRYYMNCTVRYAHQWRSPILVERVLEYAESGNAVREEHWFRYVLSFSGEREDILPRVEKIAESQELSYDTRSYARRALKWWRDGFVRLPTERPAQELAEFRPPLLMPSQINR